MRMTSKKNLLAVTLLAAVAAGVRAEGPKVSGFVDVGYNYNLQNQTANTYRAYDDKANTITLQNAKIGMEGVLKDNVGYKVDVMYGYDATKTQSSGFDQTVSTNPSKNQVDFEQAYLNFVCPITGANFTLGKFVSPFGAETVEAKDDYNISRGLLFQYTVPTTHTGLKADKGLMDGKITGTIGLVNGWDNLQDNNKSKTGIAQVGTTILPKTSITVGGSYGAEQNPSTTEDPRSTQGNGRSLLDAIVKVTPIDKLTLIANYDKGAEKFYEYDYADDVTTDNKKVTAQYSGLGLHANYQLTDLLSVAGRWEEFRDDGKNTNKTGVEQTLHSETVTVQAKKDSIIYRLEYRADQSSQYSFVNSDGMKVKSQGTVGAQVIVTF